MQKHSDREIKKAKRRVPKAPVDEQGEELSLESSSDGGEYMDDQEVV